MAIAFEEAIAEAEPVTSNERPVLLERALKLNRGDLLPSCEDEWIVPKREQQVQMRLKAMQELIEVLQEQQDYRTAIAL